jgi:hypothetical protein
MSRSLLPFTWARVSVWVIPCHRTFGRGREFEAELLLRREADEHPVVGEMAFVAVAQAQGQGVGARMAAG